MTSNKKIVDHFFPEFGNWDTTSVDRESEDWTRLFNADESEMDCDDFVLYKRNADLLRCQAVEVTKEIVDLITADPDLFIKLYEKGCSPYVEILGARYSIAEGSGKGPLYHFYSVVIENLIPPLIKKGIDAIAMIGPGCWLPVTYNESERVDAWNRSLEFNPDLFPGKCLEFRLEITEDQDSEKDKIVIGRDKVGFHKRRGELYIALESRDKYTA